MRTSILVTLLALAAGCGAAQQSSSTSTNPASAATAVAAATPAKPMRNLISRELLFGNPERANVQISPDAKQLSWLAPVNGVLNVWVAPIDKPEEALKVGEEVDVKILRVDGDERKIGLSLKRAQWAAEEEKREEQRAQRSKDRGLRGGLEGGESTTGLGDLKL